MTSRDEYCTVLERHKHDPVIQDGGSEEAAVGGLQD